MVVSHTGNREFGLGQIAQTALSDEGAAPGMSGRRALDFTAGHRAASGAAVRSWLPLVRPEAEVVHLHGIG
jgi:hypothetical protein